MFENASLTLEEVIDIYADYEKAKRLVIEAIEERKGVIIDDAPILS